MPQRQDLSTALHKVMYPKINCTKYVTSLDETMITSALAFFMQCFPPLVLLIGAAAFATFSAVLARAQVHNPPPLTSLQLLLVYPHHRTVA